MIYYLNIWFWVLNLIFEVGVYQVCVKYGIATHQSCDVMPCRAPSRGEIGCRTMNRGTLVVLGNTTGMINRRLESYVCLMRVSGRG